MSGDIRDALAAVRACVADRDADAVENAIGNLEFFILEADGWAGDLFEGVSDLLRDSAFLAIPSSYRVARLLNENWNELTSPQRNALRPLLTSAFDKFGDWMGAYVVAEIFGDRYADEAALAVLEDLSSNAATSAAHELATYGLGRFARAVPEGPLHARAVDKLNALASSSAPEVRREALQALGALPAGPTPERGAPEPGDSDF